MPSYDFECEACGEKQEFFLRRIEDAPTECPSCQCGDGRFFQVIAPPNFWVYGQPTTVGQIGEANARKLGKERMQKMKEEKQDAIKARRQKTQERLNHANPNAKVVDTSKFDDKDIWWRDVKGGEKPLDLNKVKDVKKYIATGDMS